MGTGIETPNLDKLIASGFSFRGNYVFGEFGGGMCAESRDVDDGQDMVPHRCSDDSSWLLPELLGRTVT